MKSVKWLAVGRNTVKKETMAKRYKHLYEKICTFENLWLASRKARKGKRLKDEVLDFEYNLEKELFEIHEELLSDSFEFSPYKTFTVHEPAVRLISAAPYRDRVVHHAICNIIEPILDKTMIYDSYACRTYKGMHRALDRAQSFLRKNDWVLKVDMKKYFFTVDHQILAADLENKIKDTHLLKLLANLLNTYKSGMEYYFPFPADLPSDCCLPRGLPIGNLTSQLFANYFLTPLDRFLKEDLKIKHYLRYMDDCLIYAHDKHFLKEVKSATMEFLACRRLNIHKNKTQIFPSKNGIRYLGFHIYRNYRRILRPNLKRFKTNFKRRTKDYENGEISFENLLLSLNAWLGFAGKEENYKVINHVLSSINVLQPEKKFKFQFILP